MSAPLIILDRDGVINYDSDHYIKAVDEWRPIESSLDAIAKLTKAGYSIAVATNQSGLSRGLLTVAVLDKIHKKMLIAIKACGGRIDAIVYCPDHPDNAGPDRKPAPGMALRLLSQFEADPEKTWFVGDSISDIQCAISAGCKPVLVLTGKGSKTQHSSQLGSDVPIFDNLNSFVNSIVL
jgi:D-glycero-D-manno-heptose 1,7-bisphosphate phosphatase